MTPGIHLVHKPIGPTSFSIVQQHILAAKQDQPHRTPRICHGGTLDPFASGLLLILVEPATKLFDYLHDIPKTYEATIRWGIETDNGDPFGKTTFEGDASRLTGAQLDDAIQSFNGWQDQTPHTTSAKRVDGERAYVKAHRGEKFDMPPSRVYLHEASWIGHDLPRTSELRVTVRGGYYIRALARDLGRKLNCGAHVSALTRTQIGPWTDPGENNEIELQGRAILPWLFSKDLSAEELNELREGKLVEAKELTAPEWNLPNGFPAPEEIVRGFQEARFCAILQRAGEQLRLVRFLPGGM